MLEVRTARPADLDGIRALWRLCFEDSEAFINWFFSERYIPHYSACLLEDGVIMSAIQGLPLHLNIRGKLVPALMMTGVSTHPERGGRGYMRKTITHFMQIARENGMPLVFHTPAHMPTFFSRGHFQASNTLWYTIARAHADAFPSDISAQDMYAGLDPLHACYQKNTRRYSGCVSRTMADFAYKFRDYASDGARCLVRRNEAGDALGYCVYYTLEGMLHAEECIADSGETLSLLLAALSHTANGRNVTCKLPPDAPLPPGGGKAGLRAQGAMGAADIRTLLTLVLGDERYVFEVEDKTVPQNNGVFDGCGRIVEKTPHLRISAGRLTQLLLGYHALSTLAAEGNALILDAAATHALDARLPAETCFVVDEY